MKGMVIRDPIESYERLVHPIKLHPNPKIHAWQVTLTDGKTYTVAWGNLRGWLRTYAR
jgi:hypothetical protein